MASKSWLLCCAAALVLILAACSPPSEHGSQPATPVPTRAAPSISPTPQPVGKPQGAPAPRDVWLAFLENMPHPYTTPLPPKYPTILDGFYAKIVPKEGTHVPCRRCPDYLPEGGIWRLHLDKGVFRIFHAPTGWRSLGSFMLSEDQMVLFNDPTCFEAVGFYRWPIESGALSLQLIKDTCHVDRRSQSFSNFPWSACQPPSTEAEATDHWPRPPACAEVD